MLPPGIRLPVLARCLLFLPLLMLFILCACCSCLKISALPADITRSQVVGLVGATTGVSLAFVAPGMLAMRDPQGGPAYRAFGWLLLLLGGLLMGIGMTSTEEG